MTMEDMWKDISLASLYDHNSPAGGGSAATSAANNRSAAFRGFIFQDFLAAGSTNLTPYSLACDPLPAPPVLLSLSSSGSDHFQQHQIQSTATTVPRAAPPVSVKAKKTQRMHNSATGISSVISFSNSPEVLNSFDPSSKKRTAEENGENSRHVRHKRMIKNRESASRSRARKQAYTNDLEIEIDQRREENARLKRQLEQLYAAAPAANFLELPKRAHSV